MLRTYVISAAALAMLAAPAYAQNKATTATSGPKFAYIDSQRVLQEAPGAKAAQAQFQKQMADYRAELKLLQDSINTMVSNYQDKESVLSATARQQQQKAIQAKQQAYQQRVQQLEQEANQKQQELVKPIMDKIQTVIEQIRKENDYTMIFDSSSPGLIAADPALDITDQVVARLKQMAASTTHPSK